MVRPDYSVLLGTRKKRELAELRCVFASNTSWYLYNFHQGLMQRLMDEGWEVHVVSPLDEHTSKLLAMGIHHHGITLSRRGTNPFVDFASLLQIKRLYRSTALSRQ